MAAKSRLANKIAIVTGAGSGFGRAIATRFAAEGCRVLVSDVNEAAAAETAARIGAASASAAAAADRMKVMKFDVTRARDWGDAVGEVESRWGGVDILVNNAGWTYKNRPTSEVSEQDFDRVFNINLKSIFHSISAVVPSMKSRGGGSIINISSIGSVRPRPGLVWYNASKAAVTNASLGLAAEYGPLGIRINAIGPLISNTGLWEAFSGVPYSEDNVKAFVKQVPLGRLTEPEDVANLALFLGSDEGAFVTGQNIILDGGKGI